MMSQDALRAALALPPSERLTRLLRLAGELEAGAPDAAALAEALVALIEAPELDARARMSLGETLSHVGDPRLRTPDAADYWVRVTLEEDHSLEVGRFLVTNAEWQAFANGPRYQDDALWTEEGLAWRDGERPSWSELAAAPASARLVLGNQPAVGISWHEAVAYATAHGGRLLEFDERLRVMRGPEKRPYPWGAPFGQGNANTREEVLGKPSAVGVFPRDRTPEGICDLAGNVGEWTADTVGDRRVIHPGSWEQPSMAAWAKALHIVSPAARAADLGFRIARDV